MRRRNDGKVRRSRGTNLDHRRSRTSLTSHALADSGVVTKSDGSGEKLHDLKACRNPGICAQTGNLKPCFKLAWKKYGAGAGDREDGVGNDKNVDALRTLAEQRARFCSMPLGDQHDHVCEILYHQYSASRPHGKKQEFLVNGVRVCREIFLLAYPISVPTLGRAISRVAAGFRTISRKRDTAGIDVSGAARSSLQTAAWLLLWCENNGENFPDQPFLYVPHVDAVWLRKQMNEDLALDGAPPVGRSTVQRVWAKHGLLRHVRVRRNVKLNFHACAECEALRTEIRRQAGTGGTKASLRDARLALQAHLDQQRREREFYYY